tara:strand:+ start:65 stop:358 length:294 start_codon:yes stop_codon:yes gene_type:complete
MTKKFDYSVPHDKPDYFVINPYHEQIHNTNIQNLTGNPLTFPLIRPVTKTKWVIKFRINNDVYNRFNKKLDDIRKMSEDLSLIKQSIDRQIQQLHSY